MPKLIRSEWLLWVLVALMFAGMLWGILAIQGSEVRAYRNGGRETDATVVDKFTSRSSSTDSREYNFAVSFAARSEEGGSITIGNRATFTVGSSLYDDTEINDKVTIYYLPDDTRKAALKSWVDEYNPIFLQGAMWFFVATAVCCLVAALFAPKTREQPVAEATFTAEGY